MKYPYWTILFLFLFSCSLGLRAQEQQMMNNRLGSSNGGDGQVEDSPKQNDSLLNVGNPKNVKFYSFYPKYIGYQQKIIVDTLLQNKELYNPLRQAQYFGQDLGNIGSAYKPLILDLKSNIGFDLGITAFDTYIRDLNELDLIETPSPFTQLSYVMGSKKENVLRVQHAQSFKQKQIKFGLDFKLYDAQGFYTRQVSDVKNFNANLAYRTKDRRYSVEAVYFHNKLVLQENGGIQYDSLFTQNLETNRQIISVNLSDAENYIKYDGVAVTQNFYIAKAEPDYSAIPDTNTLNLEAYTVQHYKKPYFDPIRPLGRLTHTFIYGKEIYQYSDSDGESGFYSGFSGFNSTNNSVFDSISHLKIENTFLYSNANYNDSIGDHKLFSYSFGVGLVSNRFGQDTLVNTLSEINPQGKIEFTWHKNIQVNASAIYSYRSDNTSSYNLNGNIELFFGKNRIEASFLSESVQAPWLYQHFYSDYFRWENDFRNLKFQSIHLNFKRGLTSLMLETSLINDYLYIDSDLNPTQYRDALTYSKVSLYQGLRLGHFGSDLNVIYQKISNSSVVRLPDLYSNLKLYYENNLFKGALDMQIGVNIRYFNAYYADAYMPALRSFYHQNDELLGNYPYIDVFVNAKIKRARLFLKYERLNSGFMPQNYFISPGYPNPDASLKFGVIWQLFN